MKISLKKRTRFTIMTIFILCIGSLYFTDLVSPKPHFYKTTFDQLPKWQTDDLALAFAGFKNSCAAIMKLDPESKVHSIPEYGKAKDWQIICMAANQVNTHHKEKIRAFFESWFEPYHVFNKFSPKGLFTGYYLPLINATLKKQKAFNVPVYGLPDDWVKINLRLFHPKLPNQTIIGQIKNHSLYPSYPDRAAINNGAIKKSASVLVWGNNPIDVFFAQIQGSCIVKFPNHQQMVLGYASGNGHPYTAIGKILINDYGIKKSDISMQSIREWLITHPKLINSVLNQNANYVFFKILKNKEPLGSEQVPLIPERSLAVDTHYIALGIPVWLKTTFLNNQNKEISFNHLLIAQDTGGDIKGVVRGDVYWGAGDRAAFISGHMASRGEYWVLLPRNKTL